MKLLCVNGDLKGKVAETYLSIETNWATWKRIFLNSQVVSSSTGYSRNYGYYPYGGYKNNNSLLFPISNSNGKLPMKERVHGIIHENITMAYRFNSFNNGISVLSKVIENKKIIIVGSKSDNFIVSYYTGLSDGNNLTFQAEQNNLPIILTDSEGNSWDIFGEAASGPRIGQKFEPTNSYMAYWFAWATFYPNIKVIDSTAVK